MPIVRADVVSERRRAKAIKLLEQRLSQEPSDWDVADDPSASARQTSDGQGASANGDRDANTHSAMLKV